jgi:P27 family predicted phage terminase small subunit
MGRPSKPLERLKATQRDAGHKADGREIAPVIEFKPDHSIPEPPTRLEGRAVEEWRRIWQAGWWLVRDQDYFWVEMIAKAYHNIEEWEKQIDKDGLVVEGWNGQLAAHPLIKSINQAQQIIQKCLSQLGFSPTDRARLVIKQNEAQSALEQMRERFTRERA